MDVLVYLKRKIFSKTSMNWFWALAIGQFSQSKIFFDILIVTGTADFVIKNRLPFLLVFFLAIFSARKFTKLNGIEEAKGAQFEFTLLYATAFMPAFLFPWNLLLIPIMAVSVFMMYWSEDKLLEKFLKQQEDY